MVNIRLVSTSDPALADGLLELLADGVNNGASVGFLAPLKPEKGREYWADVFNSLGPGLALWVAELDGEIVGSVQLSLCRKENGMHRAEVQKLVVKTDCRGRGIARELMNAAEAFARADGRILLVLDTETGSGAETVYQRLGWTRLGDIPNYALTADGRLCSTTYYFKQL
jgi:GNAT superfamily N-acetyltransferase